MKNTICFFFARLRMILGFWKKCKERCQAESRIIALYMEMTDWIGILSEFDPPGIVRFDNALFFP
jgi:hypothetical protein